MNKIEKLLTMVHASKRWEALAIIDSIIKNPESAVCESYEKNNEAALAHILSAIEQCTGVSIHLMQSKSRNRNLTDARQMFCFLARTETPLSFAAIAKIINRHHATVLHSMRSILGLIAFNQHNRHQLDCVLRVLEEKGYKRARKYYNEAVGQAVREKFEV